MYSPGMPESTYVNNLAVEVIVLLYKSWMSTVTDTLPFLLAARLSVCFVYPCMHYV